MIKYIILIIVVPTLLFASNKVGKFEEVKGKVSVYHKNTPRGEKANINTNIYLKDIIKTKRNSKAIVLLNNSKITLFQKSRMIIYGIENFNTENANIKTGRVLFEINSKDLQGMYKVKTPSAVVGVKGTKYMVEVFNGYSLVSVLEGIVEVNVNGYKINIKKGQKIRFNKGNTHFKNFYDVNTHNTNVDRIFEIYDNPNLKKITVDSIAKDINLEINIPR